MNEGITIMLIDDNKIDLFIHGEVVKRISSVKAVLEFTFAGDAFAYLEEQSAATWPHVILLDIHMPMMDGFEFLANYAKLPAELRRHCKVIMLSSSLNGEDHQRAKASELVHDFLGKPLDVEKLRRVIQIDPA